MSYVDWMWDMAASTRISENWVDAGLVPIPGQERGQLAIDERELVLADTDWRKVEQYANQWLATEDTLDGIVIKWKFTTPCITTLEETK